MNKKYRNEFCLKCKQENPQDQEICVCGGRNFIFGDHINIFDKKYVCDCGNSTVQLVMSMNMSPIHHSTYRGMYRK